MDNAVDNEDELVSHGDRLIVSVGVIEDVAVLILTVNFLLYGAVLMSHIQTKMVIG